MARQLSSDLLYKDLRKKGLQLTPLTSTIVPQPKHVKAGFIKRLGSLVNGKKVQEKESELIVLQILNNWFLVARDSGIFLYKYTFNEIQAKIDVELIFQANLAYSVIAMASCQFKFVQDKDVPLLLQNSLGVQYYNFDLKQQKLCLKAFIKLPNLTGFSWISQKQCLLIDNQNIHHYTIINETLKLKQKLPTLIIIEPSYMLIKIWIFSQIEDQKDSLITIFYTTATIFKPMKQKYPQMNLKIKELIRTPDGDITIAEKSDYILETQSLRLKQKFNITCVGEYFCLQQSLQILIMKKKFDKYMLLDNMTELMNGFDIKLNRKGIIVSIGQKVMELSCISFADPKCSSRVCDVIEFSESLQGKYKNFKEVWPIVNPKQYTLIFVFIQGHQINLSGLIKRQPMQKMMELVNTNPKDKIQIIQDMALNLGISKNQFYLKLWTRSNKNNGDIYQYLIPCNNVSSIKKQLKALLRIRPIQVSEMLKILQKISEINIKILKENLNQKNLKEYLKNDFLKRKIKLSKKDQMMDHTAFQKIYNSSLLMIFYDIIKAELDPEKPKFDPLNSNVNVAKQQQKTLQNVFQEFKVLLLQDYKVFLISFLSKYPKTLQILEKFNFLLPNHPFEIEVQKPSKINSPVIPNPKPNNTQQSLWFQSVTISQWQSQITKESIFKFLMNDYPTSKITQTIDEFYNSKYGQENKRWKHGLITLGVQEYRKKIKILGGIQLYLSVCEFANEVSVETNEDEKISQKILHILGEKNKLSEPDMHYCRLYSSMHYFMLKNKIIPKSKLQIISLTNLKPENLIALFFLQNKQRKQHIFTDFQNLYSNKNEFRQVLQKFVQSQNCSRIELQILMNQMISKGHRFQQQNQDLIELLISGICMKVEIRQSLLILDTDDDDEYNVGCLIDEIKLTKHLSLKVNRVKQLKKCKNIFKMFKLSKMTYHELLNKQQNNEIFKLIIQKFFQIRNSIANETQFQLLIQGECLNLSNPHNVLAILLYLHENVYYSAQTFQILVIFCMELIMWKEFSTVSQILYDQQCLAKLGISRKYLLQTVINRSLELIYLDPDIYIEDETKQQILCIINIDHDQKSPLKVRQIGKLSLVDIFMQWDLQISAIGIHIICENWKNQDREDFIMDLIQKYIQKLNFETFTKIYRLLQVIDKQQPQINEFDLEYIKYCICYCRKLMEKKRFTEAIYILSILMNINDVKIDYTMLVQCYIQALANIFPNDDEIGRRYIDFFVQNYETTEEYKIRQLLESEFDCEVLQNWDQCQVICINHHYCFDDFKKVLVQVNLQSLWLIALRVSYNIQELYYTYFFLTMGLSNPKKGFGETVGISYNLQKMTNVLLGELDSLFSQNQNLWFVDYATILAKFFLGGMLSEAAYSLNINVIDKDKKSKFELILKELRFRRAENQKNDKILNILTKLKTTQIFHRQKRMERRQRFRKRLKQMMDDEAFKNRSQMLLIESQEQEVEQSQVYLTWKKVEEQKKAISSMSDHLIEQKDLIDQIYRINNESKLKSPDRAKNRRSNIFQNLFLPKNGIEKVETVIELLKIKKYEELPNCSLMLLVEAIQRLFDEEPERDYSQVSDILEQLNFGCPQKKKIFKLAKIFISTMPNQVKRTLFSLEFLINPLQPAKDTEEQDNYLLIYQELRPKIIQLIPQSSIRQLKDIANLMGIILQSTQFEAHVYLEALVYVGSYLQFDSHSVLMAQQCIQGLGDYPQLVSNNYEAILKRMIYDKEMMPFVRENLIKLMEAKGYPQVAEEIRKYQIGE